MSGPPRRPKPPPLPRPKSPKGRRFDPSKPLMEFEEPATGTFEPNRASPPVDPALPSLELPSRTGRDLGAGLGPVAMSDPLQDAQTLVSTPTQIPQSEEPMPGGTQVVAMPIPPSAPTPSSIIPGGPRAKRSATPFIIASAAAAMAWGAAVTAGVVHEPHELPALATSEPGTSPSPRSTPKPQPQQEVAEDAAAEDIVDPTPEDTDAPAVSAAPTWSATADATPTSIQLAEGGVVIGTFEASVVGYATGSKAWAVEGAHEGAFVMSDGSVAVVTDTEVKFLSALDGSARTVATLPPRGKKTPDVVAADANAQQVLVALSDARFVQITPAACGETPAEDAGECVREVGRLQGEYLEPTSKIAIGEDGQRYLAEEDAMRGFDLDLRTLFEASTPADIRSMVRVPGGRLALQFSQEAVLLDPKRCQGRSEVRMRTADTQAPAGCVLWRYGKTIDPVAPAAVDTSSVALNERGKLQVVVEGDDAWKIPLGAFGPVAYGEGTLYTLATESDTVVLAEVDATTGTVRAKHPVPLSVGDDERGDTQLVWRAGTVAASIGPNIGVVTLTP